MVLPFIPAEIVDIIIAYCDYKKQHKKTYQYVLNDIHDMNAALITITPEMAYTCWNDYGWKKYLNKTQYGLI